MSALLHWPGYVRRTWLNGKAIASRFQAIYRKGDVEQVVNAKRASLAGREQTPALQSLLTTAKLIKKNTVQAEAVKAFLEAPRKDALKILQDAWTESISFNELKLMPDIVCEGEWTNQPQETREFLLNLIDAIPEGKWWSLNSFVRDIKQKYADFQRPASDYDSWFIKRESDGQYLRGFSYWDQVDGALIKYFITNILHWLGQVDLSIAEGATEATSFRVRSNAEGQKSDVRPSTFDEKGKISVSSNGKISVERLAPRVVRYQIARFCEWGEEKADEFKYQITAESLKHAKEQGLKAEQLLALLRVPARMRSSTVGAPVHPAVPAPCPAPATPASVEASWL
jgi:hypothetical protein